MIMMMMMTAAGHGANSVKRSAWYPSAWFPSAPPVPLMVGVQWWWWCRVVVEMVVLSGDSGNW